MARRRCGVNGMSAVRFLHSHGVSSGKRQRLLPAGFERSHCTARSDCEGHHTSFLDFTRQHCAAAAPTTQQLSRSDTTRVDTSRKKRLSTLAGSRRLHDAVSKRCGNAQPARVSVPRRANAEEPKRVAPQTHLVASQSCWAEPASRDDVLPLAHVQRRTGHLPPTAHFRAGPANSEASSRFRAAERMRMPRGGSAQAANGEKCGSMRQVKRLPDVT